MPDETPSAARTSKAPPIRATPEDRRRANSYFLDAIRALWDQVPDQRFGQLVMNLSREPGGFMDTWEWSNADWMRRVEEAFRTWAKPTE